MSDEKSGRDSGEGQPCSCGESTCFWCMRQRPAEDQHCFTARGDHDCCLGRGECSCLCTACEDAHARETKPCWPCEQESAGSTSVPDEQHACARVRAPASAQPPADAKYLEAEKLLRGVMLYAEAWEDGDDALLALGRIRALVGASVPHVSGECSCSRCIERKRSSNAQPTCSMCTVEPATHCARCVAAAEVHARRMGQLDQIGKQVETIGATISAQNEALRVAARRVIDAKDGETAEQAAKRATGSDHPPTWALVSWLWDRREQYKPSSGTYAAFDELLVAAADGAHVDAWKHGELDDLRACAETILARRPGKASPCARPAGVTEESETAQRTVDEMMREAATPNASLVSCGHSTNVMALTSAGAVCLACQYGEELRAKASPSSSLDQRSHAFIYDRFTESGNDEDVVVLDALLADVRRETIEACVRTLRDLDGQGCLELGDRSWALEAIITELRSGEFTRVDPKGGI